VLSLLLLLRHFINPGRLHYLVLCLLFVKVRRCILKLPVVLFESFFGQLFFFEFVTSSRPRRQDFFDWVRSRRAQLESKLSWLWQDYLELVIEFPVLFSQSPQPGLLLLRVDDRKRDAAGGLVRLLQRSFLYLNAEGKRRFGLEGRAESKVALRAGDRWKHGN